MGKCPDQTGEPTLETGRLEIFSKSMEPLPENGTDLPTLKPDTDNAIWTSSPTLALKVRHPFKDYYRNQKVYGR